jgi:hypothetical protein
MRKVFRNIYLVLDAEIVVLRTVIQLPPKDLSLIFLVIIPIFIAVSYVVRDQISSFFQMYFMSGDLAITIIGIIEIGSYLIMLYMYVPYKGRTLAFNLWKPLYTILKNPLSIIFGGFESSSYLYREIVIEYSLVTKIILIAVPLFIIITTLSFVEPRIRMPFGLLVNTIMTFQQTQKIQYDMLYELLSALWAGLFFTVSGGLLRMLLWVGGKESRYNFARGWAIVSKEKGDNHTKLEYLMISMNSYNKFLQRTLRVRINEQIHSKIARVAVDTPEKIDEIDAFFDSDDKLSPAAQMSKLQDLNPVNDEFFVKAKIPAIDIIKDWGAVAAVVIPLVITIIKEASSL